MVTGGGHEKQICGQDPRTTSEQADNNAWMCLAAFAFPYSSSLPSLFFFFHFQYLAVGWLQEVPSGTQPSCFHGRVEQRKNPVLALLFAAQIASSTRHSRAHVVSLPTVGGTQVGRG